MLHKKVFNAWGFVSQMCYQVTTFQAQATVTLGLFDRQAKGIQLVYGVHIRHHFAYLIVAFS
jgi:hypothetical protein